MLKNSSIYMLLKPKYHKNKMSEPQKITQPECGCLVSRNSIARTQVRCHAWHTLLFPSLWKTGRSLELPREPAKGTQWVSGSSERPCCTKQVDLFLRKITKVLLWLSLSYMQVITHTDSTTTPAPTGAEIRTTMKNDY